MKVFPIAEGLEAIVTSARFHDVDTTLLITRGLLAHGQKECVIALKTQSDDTQAFATKYMRTLDMLARKGRLIDAGGLSTLPNGVAPVDGFCFAPVHAIGAQLGEAKLAADDVLFAVPLRGNEVEMVQRAGGARVLARLGLATRFFPFPPWVDVERPSVVTKDDLAATIMGVKVPPPASFPGVRIEIISERVVVTLSVEVSHVLADGIKSGAVLALACTEMGVGSSAAFVFDPKSKGPSAITAAKKHDEEIAQALPGTSGSFLVLAIGAPSSVLLEDGFVRTIEARDWSELATALSAGRSIELSSLSIRVQPGRRVSKSSVPAATIESAGASAEASKKRGFLARLFS